MRVNYLLTTTALTTSAVFAAGSALAQPAAYSWTGFYVGLNAGWASADISHEFTIPGYVGATSSGRDGGFTGGGQAGYNWQFARQWVLGIEGDINYLRGQRTSSFSFANLNTNEDVVGTQHSRIRWLSTVRGRFGYVWDRSFLFVTGGLAIGGVSSQLTATVTDANSEASFLGTASSTRTGWSVGAGFEHAFTSRISMKLEYLHFDLGEVGYNALGTVISAGGTSLPFVWPASARFDGDIVRFGINYKLTP
jgi:outer membrane immunogenic protein